MSNRNCFIHLVEVCFCCCWHSHFVPFLFLKVNQITAIYEKLMAKNEQVDTLVLEHTRSNDRNIQEIHTWNTILFIIAIESNRTIHILYSMCEWMKVSNEDEEKKRADKRERKKEEKNRHTHLNISFILREQFFTGFFGSFLRFLLGIFCCYSRNLVSQTNTVNIQSAMSSQSRIHSDLLLLLLHFLSM